MPKLFRVILPVSDITRARQFYSLLLGLPGKRVSPGRHYFDCGGTILACYDPKADGDSITAIPNPDHIYIAVSDLDAAYARAKSAGCQWLEEKIKKRDWGERSIYAKDPFGNPICLVDEKSVFTG
jgi:predicted enzyme related to lactoylglutathione lyase